MNIPLKNSYVFPYDDSKKFVCYFGCNSVGKTVISNALDEKFTSDGKEVLHFSNDIMDKMIDLDEKTKRIQIFPKITEIHRLEKEKEKYTSKYSFNQAMKEVGLSTMSDRKMFENIAKCSAEDGIVVDETKAEYIKEDLVDIFNNKKEAKKSFYQLITDDSFVDQLHLIEDFSSIAEAVNISVINVRKQIVDNNLDKCPVCFSSIDSDKYDEIKKAIDTIALDDDFKNDLLFHIKKKTNITIFLDLIRNKNNYNDWINKFKRDLDDSLIAYAYSKIDNKDSVTTFRKTVIELNSLKAELAKYEIPEEDKQNDYEKRVSNLLKEHKVFNRKGISIAIKKGRLETNGISYGDLSQSEKNFLKYLYYDILLLSKHIDSKVVDLIIDDPFDSYDEATISNLLCIITNSFEQYSSSIVSAYIFSHSIRLVYFFKEVKRIKDDFELKWIDKYQGDKTLHIFGDCGIMEKIDFSPSDYWLANIITKKSTDEYSFLCSALILREFAFEANKLLALRQTCNDCITFYNLSSDKVVHLRDLLYRIEDLYNEFKKYFVFSNDVKNKSKTIYSLMQTIDENTMETINLSFNTGEILDNTIYKLFIAKYLLALRIRQLLEEYIHFKHSDLTCERIGDNLALAAEKYYKDIDHISQFYNKNKLILNEFAHSFTKSFSPYFTYCYEDLTSLYIETKKITSK